MLNQPAFQGATRARRRPRLRHRLQPRARRLGAARLRLQGRARARASATSSAATRASRGCSPAQITEDDVERIWAADRGAARESRRRSTWLRGRRPSATSTVPFEIDDYTRWRLLEGPRRHRRSPCATKRRSRSSRPPRESGDPRTLPVRQATRTAREWNLTLSANDAQKAGEARRTDVRRDRHQRRQAAARTHRGARREEPRHQGDGRGPARRDPQRAARRARHQRRRGRARAARGARRRGDRAPKTGELRFDPSNVETAHFAEIDAHAGSSRIPILFCGPLLHRLGEALIPDLGGCRIGDRPIDFHLDALRAFGAVVDKSYEGIRITAPNGLHGANIELPYPSVGATEQVLLTAVRAEGITELQERGDRARDHGPHRHPAEDGRDHLGRAEPRHPHRGRRHASTATRTARSSTATRPPAGPAAALATDGDIFVGGAKQQEMMTFLNVFRKVGGAFDVARGRHPLLPPRRRRSSRSSVETDVHPGFMTDWQQPLIVALTQADGRLDRARDRVREPLRLHRRARSRWAPTSSCTRTGSSGHPRRVAAPRLRAGRRHHRPDAAARRRRRGARPARRLQLPDRRARPPRAQSTVSNVGIISRGYEHFIDEARRARRRLRRRGLDRGGTPTPHRARRARARRRRRPSVFWLARGARRPVHAACSRKLRDRGRREAARRAAPFVARAQPLHRDRPARGRRRGLEAGRAAALPGQGEPVPGAGARLGAAGDRAGPGRARSSAASAHARRSTRREQLVEQGRGVVIYPEGSLTRDPDLWPMRGKTGAVRMALEARHPADPDGALGHPEGPAALRQEDQPVPAQDHRASRSATRSTCPRSGASRSTPATLTAATDVLMDAITALLGELRGENAAGRALGSRRSTTRRRRVAFDCTRADPHRRPGARRVAVLGAGSWGTTFAKILADGGADVALWARRPELAREISRGASATATTCPASTCRATCGRARGCRRRSTAPSRSTSRCPASRCARTCAACAS